MRHIFLLFIFILCTCAPALAQLPLSLDEAIQRGLENNYAIRVASSELDAVRNDNDYALTGKRPTVTVGVSPGISYRKNSNPASIVAQSNTTSYSVAPTANLNWTLFSGGRIEIAKDQLATLADLSAGQLQIQVENSVQDIINAYYNARVQDEQLVVRRRVLSLSRDRIDYQQVRREYGQGGTFDELQARDAYLTDSIALVQQEVVYENSLRDLLQVMGADDLTQDIMLTDSLTFDPAGFSLPVLEEQLELTNSQLRTLRVSRSLADLNTRLIETERKPTISLNAGASYDISVQTGTQTFDFGGEQPSREQDLPGVAARTLAGNLGIGVNYLLFDGGSRSVRAQTARLREITAELDYRGAEQQLRALLTNTLARYKNQVRLVDIARQRIANAEQNLGIADERFRGGTINSFDYRTIQLSYINAEFQLLNALLELKVTETELLRLTGQITG